jgi:4-diphosphocytidyl-2-C-methyl-D-erythritol kinase
LRRDGDSASFFHKGKRSSGSTEARASRSVRVNVRQGFAGCEVLAAAKLNLLLEVLGRRSDGYHEIETLMVPVNLFDRVWVEVDHSAPQGELRCECHWVAGLSKCGSAASGGTSESACASAAGRRCRPPSAEWEDLPQGSENIVIRALELLRSRAGVEFGATVRLTKRIPSAAGLGGGSSDAAAALLAANRVWKLGWSRQQLQRLGAEVGCDVPFFLASGAAKCIGRGEQIEPLGNMPSIDFVVVAPPGGLSTAEVYRSCQPSKSHGGVGRLIAALSRKDLTKIANEMHNQLEPTAEQLSPWIARAKRELSECGCAAVQMSGSGTSCFGVCRDARQARRAARWMRSRGWSRSTAVRSIRSTH